MNNQLNRMRTTGRISNEIRNENPARGILLALVLSVLVYGIVGTAIKVLL